LIRTRGTAREVVCKKKAQKDDGQKRQTSPSPKKNPREKKFRQDPEKKKKARADFEKKNPKSHDWRMKLYRRTNETKERRVPRWPWAKRVDATRKFIDSEPIFHKPCVVDTNKLLLRHVHEGVTLLACLVEWLQFHSFSLSQDSYVAILRDVQEHGFNHRNTSPSNSPLTACMRSHSLYSREIDSPKYEFLLLLTELLLQQPSSVYWIIHAKQEDDVCIANNPHLCAYNWVDIPFVELLYRYGVLSCRVIDSLWYVCRCDTNPTVPARFLKFYLRTSCCS